MELKVNLSHDRHCFAHLPNDMINELLDSPSPLASLKLSWQTAETQHDVFVGWDGGASEGLGLIDVPLELANCLGLAQDMQVRIDPVFDSVEPTEVFVAPMTEDDWEIIERNPNHLEQNMLNQINVVYEGMQFPYYIGNFGFVRLKVVSSFDGGCAKLTRDAEVIVESKDRKKRSTSPPQVAKGRRGGWAREVAAAGARGWATARLVEAGAPPEAGVVLCGKLGAIVGVPHGGLVLVQCGAAPVGNAGRVKVCQAIARVHCDTGMPFGVVHMAKETQMQLKAQLHAKLLLLPVLHAPTAFSGLSLRPINWATGSTHQYPVAEMRAALVDRVVNAEWELPAMADGSTVLQLNLENFGAVDFVCSFTIASEEQESTTAQQYVLLSATSNLAAALIGQAVSRKKPAEFEPLSLSALGGYTDCKAKMVAAVRPVVAGHATGGLGMLLVGQSGAGKTSLSRAIATEFWCEMGAWVEVFNCRELHGKKPDEVTKRLQRALVSAVANSPSVLIWDDFNQIVPALDDDPSNEAASQEATKLAASLCDIIGQVLGAHPSSVVLIATAPSAQAVHPALIRSGLLAEVVKIPALDRQDRSAVLKSLLLADSIATDVDTLTIATKTEGYSPRDLRMLVQRARHEHTRRAPLDEDSVLTEDFHMAIKNFTPASLAKVKKSESQVEWNDVGGLVEVKSMLRETMELPMRYAALFEEAPIRLRSGLLLYGPPGCGKTLIASAVANECGLNFVSVKGPELLNKYIGASEAAVRDLFAKAAAAKPCVVFFDEFDAIAPKRGHDSTGVTDRVVNQLLTYLDGVEAVAGVYVLAATSRPDLVDAALLRPGRLDKALLCGFLDTAEDRLSVLEAIGRKLRLDDSVELESVAQQTEGFTGADMQALMHNAQLLAVHHVLDAAQEAANTAAAGEVSEVAETFTVVNVGGGINASVHADIKQGFEAYKSTSRVAAAEVESNSSTSGNSLPTISAEDIAKALETTKPSMSLMEQVRYREIYDLFAGVKDKESKPLKLRSSLA